MSSLSERQSRFDLKTILDTSRLLVESHDLDFILNNLLLICMGKLMASKAAVFFEDDDNGHLKIIKSKGIAETNQRRVFLDKLPPSARTLSVTDLKEYDVESEIYETGIRWILPIRTQNQFIGYLGLGNRAGAKELDTHELEFLESITILSAAGIANSNLFRELKATNRRLDVKVQELNTLFELSKEFNATVDRDQILRIFKFALMGQFFIRTFFMILQNKDGNISIPAGSGLQQHFSDEDLKKILDSSDEIRKVSPELYKEVPALESNSIEALIPLRYEDEFNAVVGIGKRAGDKSYTESDYEFIRSVGNLTLLSIQKTYLLEEQIEKRRIEEDLKLARTIQLKLLPEKAPDVKGLDLFGKNLSSRQIGGDYYEMFEHEGKVHCAIADVTGKGVSASLMMANLQSMFHVLVPLKLDMSKTMERLNEILNQNTTSDTFITFFWCIVDPESRRVTYSNGGHNPPLYFSAGSEEAEELTVGGLLLGAMPTMTPYKTGGFSYKPGDLIVMYTDGVTEAMNSESEEYGEERLVECIRRVKHQAADSIWDAVTRDVTAFSGVEYGDDVTMLIIKFTE